MTQPFGPPREENPHAEDEDPLANVGVEIPDPWDDEAQADWPNEEVEV